MKTLKIIIILLLLSSCVQEKHLKTVTFKVDMRGEENIGKVGVRGQFTMPSWKKTVYLSDEDNDSIYNVTLSREAAQNGFYFKFVNQDSIYELKNLDNRFIKLEYKPENIIYEAVFNNPNGTQTKE